MHSASITSIVIAALAASAAAQSNTTQVPYAVDPNSVEGARRDTWCRAQRNTCGQLCEHKTEVNSCDSTKLTFECKCVIGRTPNITDFAQSLPSLMCDEWKSQCIRSHPDDLDGQTVCLDVTCGSKNATNYSHDEPTTSKEESSPSETAKPEDKPEDTNENKGDNEGHAIRLAQNYGLFAIVAAIGVAFGVGL